MSRAAGDPVMGEESSLIEWKGTEPVFLVKSKLMSGLRLHVRPSVGRIGRTV